MLCSHLEFEHFIRLNRAFVNQLGGSLRPRAWNPVLNTFAGVLQRAIGKWIGKRQVLRHETQLKQHGQLVPGDVFVVQTVTSNIDHCGKWNAKFLAGWGNSGYPISRGKESQLFNQGHSPKHCLHGTGYAF